MKTLPIRSVPIAAIALAWATPGLAQGPAQLPSSGGLSHGYGDAGAAVSRPTDFGLRDQAGNLVIVNGVLSAYPNTAMPAMAGAGGQTATAIGNQITVQAYGSWNTIIVDAVQQNSGDVTASTSLGRSSTTSGTSVQEGSH